MDRRHVLLTSAGTGVGNAALTALHRSTFEYLAIVSNTEPFHSGVFRSDVCHLTPRAEDDPERWLSQIVKIVESEGVRLVLPCRDADIALISRFRERIHAVGATVAVPDSPVAAACVDKMATDTLLRGWGLATPVTAVASEPAAVERVTRTGYPIIAKPRRGTGTVGVRLIHDEPRLATFLAGVAEHAEDWILQEYLPIEGPRHSVTDYTELAQDQEYSIQLLYDADGYCRAWMATVNTLENGLPVAVRYERSAPTIAAVDRLPSPLHGVVGPLNLQARLRAGELVFFEANARLTGLTGARTQFGFNELDVLWNLLVEGQAPPAITLAEDICVFRNLEDTAFSTAALSTLNEAGQWRR